jgi:hypothetical protein
MAMKYNRALDYATLALASGKNGDVAYAVKMLAMAIKSPDIYKAVEILEASNKQAKAAVKTKSTAAAKPVKKTISLEAAKRIKADEDDFDMGDDEQMSQLTGGMDEGEMDEMDGGDMAEAAYEEDEENKDFDAQIATVLAAMEKNKKVAKKK